jgi:hypothetical protein
MSVGAVPSVAVCLQLSQQHRLHLPLSLARRRMSSSVRASNMRHVTFRGLHLNLRVARGLHATPTHDRRDGVARRGRGAEHLTRPPLSSDGPMSRKLKIQNCLQQFKLTGLNVISQPPGSRPLTLDDLVIVVAAPPGAKILHVEVPHQPEGRWGGPRHPDVEGLRSCLRAVVPPPSHPSACYVWYHGP